MTGQKQTGIHQIYCARLFWNMPLSVHIETLLIDCEPAVVLLSLLLFISSCTTQIFLILGNLRPSAASSLVHIRPEKVWGPPALCKEA